MPPSSNQASINQHPAANNPYILDGVLEPRSSGRRRGKGRRKFDVEEADENGVPVTNATSGEV